MTRPGRGDAFPVRSPSVATDRATVQRLVLGLIVLTALARLALAFVLGPSVDESYAVVMGRRLALSYYDHPPLLFWLPGLAARLAHSEAPIVVRLPFVLMFMGTTWLMYRLGAFHFGERAGLWAALALNLALFFTLPTASWVLPDGPLLFWSAAAALCLSHATAAAPSRRATAWWLGFGACSGLALLSKYHAVFLLGGAALYLLTSPAHRSWLRRTQPFAAVALAATIFMPVVVWNATHGWASILFQADRATPLEASEGTPLVDMVLGQAAWMLPWVWLPLLVVLFAALRRGPSEPRGWLLVCLAIGPIALFTLVAALGTRGLPHWQAPGYFMLLPLLGWEVSDRLARGAAWVQAWAWGSLGGLVLVIGLIVAQDRAGVVDRLAPRLLLRGDPTDDLTQWRPVAVQLERWGYPRARVVIAGAVWADAAKLSYALGPGVLVTSVGPDPRGFAFLEPQTSLVGQDVLLVARRRSGPESMVFYAPYFQRITALGTIDILKTSHSGIAVSVYLGEHLLRPVPLKRGR